MVFQYKVVKRARFEGLGKPEPTTEEEQLIGVLQGKSVPKDEERFYKAMKKTRRVRKYFVQVDLGHRGLPEYRTLDALVDTDFGWRAFEVDGVGFVHRGERKRNEDRLADLQRLRWLYRMGIQPKRGIEHVPDSDLMTQEQADRTARKLVR